MTRDPVKRTLLGVALVLALAGAALGRGTTARPAPSIAAFSPTQVAPFDVARVLSENPPGTVVVTLDDARHPLRNAHPSSLYGRTDDELVAHAPQHVTLILAGRDTVRMDRLARRLNGAGHRARVLAGGLAAWDRAMDADPSAPSATASPDVWARYRMDTALRRSFGDAAPTASPVVARPVAPAPTPSGGGSARREGC